MRIFRSLFLVVIASIVLVHSVMPHEHHDKTESLVCVTDATDDTNDIFDWIILGLHMNQGEGHLEHFLKDQKAALNFDVVAIPVSINPISFEIQLKEMLLINSGQIIKNDHIQTSQQRQPHGLRAPPLA